MTQMQVVESIMKRERFLDFNNKKITFTYEHGPAYMSLSGTVYVQGDEITIYIDLDSSEKYGFKDIMTLSIPEYWDDYSKIGHNYGISNVETVESVALDLNKDYNSPSKNKSRWGGFEDCVKKPKLIKNDFNRLSPENYVDYQNLNIYGYDIDSPVETVFIKEQKVWYDSLTKYYSIVVVLEDGTYIQSDLHSNKKLATRAKWQLLQEISDHKKQSTNKVAKSEKPKKADTKVKNTRTVISSRVSEHTSDNSRQTPGNYF